MAKVEYADAIKTVSGALTKINKKSQHAADQKVVLATHRVAPTQNPNCTRLFIRDAEVYKRTTPVTTEETRIRNRFSAVAAAVAARSKDLMKISADQAAFAAQKDQPNGKKTMRAFLWSLEKATYDAEHQG